MFLNVLGITHPITRCLNGLRMGLHDTRSALHNTHAYLSCAAWVGCKTSLNSSHNICERLEVRASYFNHSCDASTLCSIEVDCINATFTNRKHLPKYLLFIVKDRHSRLQWLPDWVIILKFQIQNIILLHTDICCYSDQKLTHSYSHPYERLNWFKKLQVCTTKETLSWVHILLMFCCPAWFCAGFLRIR